jgi:hypothetical protein
MRGIIDSYIIIGWYYPQFYYLNKDWLFDKIESFKDLNEDLWLGFMGGFLSSNPPFDKELYKIMISHYEKAIHYPNELKGMGGHKIIMHFISFYFWKYKSFDESLLKKLIETSSIEILNSLIHKLWIQNKYVAQLDDIEQELFENQLILVWKFLLLRFKELNIESVESDLTYFLKLFRKINHEILDLIKLSYKLRANHSRYDNNNSIEAIEKFIKNKSKVDVIADLALLIINPNYFLDKDKSKMIKTIEFLYQNGQKIAADELCNKISAGGNDFLRDIYNSYNS